ncbi:cytochrome P450 [Streptomyces olivaceus]|uniref:cytochrome P450 n=1 Tax=Streptomyces olivaceus TaxID=47716 RepID=UPI001CCD2BED|nr:cytochrome P450 [Streptomyces olivaceus]MBZ6113609.1 cytochrome P450 [Streptomyces olivaceus]MBZ6127476.1 cytochrome P450 [Streptomyces olivaceus]MBZ6148237.1 cytochrome P450 [Streptomyces olivaceus]MBZ6162154.1 cytochrome P450 [Streptomyces olivaceus]MBZ6189957.1 cytochrome P450 [Streptomyces olivaceus]
MTLVAPPPIPRAAGSLPFLGHAVQLMRDNLGFVAALRTTYGPLVEITLQPGTRTLVVQDPGLIRTMLTDLGPSLDKGRFFEKMGQLLGDSVVTAAGQVHVRKRRQLQPAFAREQIARYVDTMRAETDAAVDEWVPGRPLDVREAMVGLSLNMLAKTIFSGSLDDATFRRLRADLSVVMNGVGARVMLPDWVERLPLPANRRFNAARDGVRATIERAVSDLQDSGHDTGDMLSLLLRTTDEETGEPLTGHQISSEILTLAVAGTETTASVLSWMLYELARNPEVEARVLEELDEVLGDRPVAFDDLGRLPYLGRVVEETLRMHHTGWLVTRRTVTETRLGPWTVPPGTELAYCQHALHRDPLLFRDPLEFDPDRWLDAPGPRPTQGFLPFGAGKHKCIGDRFAFTELVTAVATIVRRVRLELAPGQTVRPVAAATVRPRTLLMTVREKEGQEA